MRRGRDARPFCRCRALDNAMVKALARVVLWQRMLDADVCGTTGELAKLEGVNRAYVSQVLRLTLRAPEIAEGILDGRQLEGLQLADLLEGFPVDWEGQSENTVQREGLSGR